MTATCPICRRPAAPRTRPFCSLRCSEVDLGRWLTEAYVIPGDAADAASEPGDASSDGERRRRVDPT